MGKLSNELLSAYMDGRLAADEAARVYLALPHDMDARRRLEAMGQADGLVREALEWRSPDEAELIAKIAAQMEVQPAPRLKIPKGLLAASLLGLAAAAGFATAHLAAPKDVLADPNRGLTAGGSLARALEGESSAELGPPGVAMTFRAADGRFCRRFSWRLDLEGLACRSEGRWRLLSLSTPDASGGGLSEGVVAQSVQRVGIAQILDLQTEGAVMRARWKPLR